MFASKAGAYLSGTLANIRLG